MYLFLTKKRDGYQTNCYNTDCPGFILTDKSNALLGSPINQVSTYGGPQYNITIKVSKVYSYHSHYFLPSEFMHIN